MEALYSSRATGRIETEITFEDGRKGQMRAELAIRDVRHDLCRPLNRSLEEGELSGESGSASRS